MEFNSFPSYCFASVGVSNLKLDFLKHIKASYVITFISLVVGIFVVILGLKLLLSSNSKKNDEEDAFHYKCKEKYKSKYEYSKKNDNANNDNINDISNINSTDDLSLDNMILNSSKKNTKYNK